MQPFGISSLPWTPVQVEPGVRMALFLASLGLGFASLPGVSLCGWLISVFSCSHCGVRSPTVPLMSVRPVDTITNSIL